jgi:hypothetical protein
MAQQVLDIPTFRLLYPEFANVTAFPDAYITAQWGVAVATMGDFDGWALRGPALLNGLNLLTAHQMKLALISGSGGSGGGGVTGVVTGATIDKVSVQLAAPTTKSGWQYWLASTPYGMQLWAFLSIKSAGGLYIGGRPERRAFRKVGGNFLP